MITGLDHIAIIVSAEAGIEFYTGLGFIEEERYDRGYDTIVYMKGYGIILEIYVDATHPQRITNPEAMGLRHLALRADHLEQTIRELGVDAEPIREKDGRRYTFIKDPDGLPIELYE